MGQDTNLFVATKKENILQVMPKVIEAINKWQRFKLDEYWKSEGFESRGQFLYRKDKTKNKGFSNGIINVDTSTFTSFNIHFEVKGEKRSVFITHTCSCDYSEIYEGEKIIFSLGYWGMSEKIMMVVANAVKDFGDVYFVLNDCGEKEFEKLIF